MTEPRRIPLNQVKNLAKEKKTKDIGPTIRLELKLFESNDQKCPEFSYIELTQKYKSPKKEGQSPAEHDLFDDDSLDNDKADIEALARSLEKKYGPKKRRRLEDFIDRGSGYDETDPFIDNDEAYDELVPSTLTTKHGGFYINCGDLDFKVLSDSDGSEPPRAFRKKKRKLRSSSSENGPEMAKKKRRVHKDIAESNIEVKAEVKPATPPPPLPAPDVVKKQRGGRRTTFSKLSSALPPTKKKPASPTVAQMIQQLREKSPPKRDLSPPKLEKTVEQVVENGATPQEDQDMEQVSPEPVVEPPSLVVPTPAAVEQPIPAAPSAPKTSTISDEDEDTPGSGTLVIDEGPLASEPPKLPDGLEADLLELINSLKEAATNNNEGKCKFFSTDINKKLLQVEVLTKALSCTHRSVVFTHLAAFLPCTKETLLKRAKKLRLDQEDGRVRLPLAKLKDAVNAAMPKMLEKHDAVSKKNSKQPSTEGPRENGDVAKTGEEEEEEGLSPRFEWTAETRDLLCQVVDAKIRCFELFKTRTQSPEDYLKQFLETEVKPIWPLRWMQTRILFEESKSVHSHLTTKPKKSLPAGSIASRKVKQEPSGGSPLPLDLDHIEIIPIPPLESEPVDIKPPRSMAAASSEPKAKPLPPLPDAKPIKIPNDTKSSKFLNTPETKSNKTNTTTICEVKSNKALTICETKPKHQSEAAAVKFRPEPKLKVASLPSGTEVRPVKPAMSLIQDMKMKQAAESKAAESSRNWVTKTGSPPKTTVSSTPTSLLNKTTPSHSEVLFTKLTTMPSSDMRQKSVLDGAKAHSSPRSSPDSSSANKRLLNNLMNSADLQVHATGSSSLLDQIICASLANYPNSNSSPEIPKPELQILEVGTGKPVQHRNLGLKETKPLPPASSLTKASSKPTTTYSTPSEGVKLPHLPYGFNEAFKKSLQNSGPSSIETKVVSSYVSRDAVSSTDYVGDEYSKIRKAQKYAAASAKKPTFPEGMKGFPLPIKGEGSPFSPTAAPHLHKSPSPSSPGGSYQYSPDTRQGSASPWRVSVSSPGYSAPSPVYSNHPHIVTAHRTAPPMDPTPTHYTTSSHKPPDFTSHKLTDYPQTSSHKPPDFSSPPHKLSEYPQTSSHKPLEFSQSPLKLPDYPQTASHKPPDYTHSYPQTSSHKPPDYLHNPQTTSHYMQQQQQHKGYPSKQDSIIHMRKQQDSSALFQQLSKQQDMYQTGGAELYNQRKAYPHLHKVPPDPQMYRQQQQQQQQDYLSSSSRPPYHSTWPTPPYTNCATDSYNTSSQTGPPPH